MLIAVGTRAGAARARGAVRADGGRCRLDAVDAPRRRRSASSRARRSSSSGRTTRRTATTRRTSRCSSRRCSAARRASSPRSSRPRPRRCPRSSAPRSPGPGFVNLWLADAWFGEALAETRARATAAASPAQPERVQVEMVSANPTGPITVAVGAERRDTATRVARLLEFAGHEVEREYYYNDAGAQMDRFRASVEAVRRGEEPPEDGYHGDYIARARREPRATRCRAMLERIEATLERFRIHFDSWAQQSELERELAGAARRGSTRTRRTARVWARSTALRRREGPRRSLRSETGGSRPTARPTSPTSRQARARLRPGDLRARRRPPRLRRRLVRGGRARCSATTPSASRCCSTSSST